jgi:hypothetical protein
VTQRTTPRKAQLKWKLSPGSQPGDGEPVLMLVPGYAHGRLAYLWIGGNTCYGTLDGRALRSFHRRLGEVLRGGKG